MTISVTIAKSNFKVRKEKVQKLEGNIKFGRIGWVGFKIILRFLYKF